MLLHFLAIIMPIGDILFKCLGDFLGAGGIVAKKWHYFGYYAPCPKKSPRHLKSIPQLA
jgi:hypothetical protein